MKRRSFLKTAAAVATPFVGRLARAAAGNFDPDFGTAQEALRALRGGAISSRELTAHVFQRIRKFNPKINAFVTLLEEQAQERARQADEGLAAGRDRGPLAGLPILIKDAFPTAGIRTTCGSKKLENYVPKEDAAAVGRLQAAGAVLIGKTNLPEFASDMQSYNDIAGTTNNPWDTSLTPGGSTGGGAAALAAGLGFLELGSDIGGSIRTPSHFCGVYGLKPTLNVVPLDGHIPPPPGVITDKPYLPVAGPLARSAQDLLLELEVIAGPAPGEATAYHWRLPAARGSRLKDYRIGYVLDDAFCPVGSDVKGVMARAIEALRKADVDLVEGWPDGYKAKDGWDTYYVLLGAAIGMGLPEDQLKPLREAAGKPWEPFAKAWLEGATLPHARFVALTEARLKARALWQEYFQTHDAFLLPVNIVPAFPHDQKLSFFERFVSTPEGQRNYGDMLKWISPATLTGCPAAVAPVGRTSKGLPVGVQIMGPYLEDATPIAIAGRMADVVGGFEAPPGFSS